MQKDFTNIKVCQKEQKNFLLNGLRMLKISFKILFQMGNLKNRIIYNPLKIFKISCNEKWLNGSKKKKKKRILSFSICFQIYQYCAGKKFRNNYKNSKDVTLIKNDITAKLYP